MVDKEGDGCYLRMEDGGWRMEDGGLNKVAEVCKMTT